MKTAFALLSSALVMTVWASGQVPQQGFGDKGCPSASVLPQTASISAEDYIEVQRTKCFTNCPLYKVRLYGDGRLVWHGNRVVRSMGDATATIEAGHAQALISKALKSGFGSLCDEYVMRGFDGTFSTTSVRIGGEIKTVADDAPSNAPVWLRRLGIEIEALDAVQNLIGSKQNQRIPDER
jgi:hypothetical protein